MFNLLNYFATSICKGILQVVISTGVLKIFAQVSISKLTQVHNSYLYLLKEKTNTSKNFTNLTNRIKEKLDWSQFNCFKETYNTASVQWGFTVYIFSWNTWLRRHGPKELPQLEITQLFVLCQSQKNIKAVLSCHVIYFSALHFSKIPCRKSICFWLFSIVHFLGGHTIMLYIIHLIFSLIQQKNVWAEWNECK